MRNLLSNLEAVLPQFCIAERCEFNCHSHPQMAYHSAHRNFCCAHHFPSTRPRHPGIERGRRKKLKSLEAPLYQTDPTNTYEHIPILLVGYASYASSVRMPRCHTEGASVRSTASNLTELCIRTVALVIPQIAHQLKRQGQKENRRKTEGKQKDLILNDFDMLIAHAGFAFLVISFCGPVCSLLPQHSTCPSVLTAQL